MKQKLLKILALTAMGLSLVSCGDAGSTSEAGSSEAGSSEAESEVEVVPVTAAGLMSLASDGSWEYLGQRVAISDSMTVGGHYGNTYFTTITDPGDGRVYGVEVEAEDPGFEGSGYGAAVTVEGTVTDVNGRMVLTDGIITITSEREYDEDGNRISGTGGAVYYYSYWGRSSWDGNLNRTFSSILYEDVYALITVPGTVTTDSETYFYVNFPGEDPDADFSTNTSLIRVTIPAGLSEDAVSNINTFFADYEAGDFIDLTCYWQYDSVSNYGMGLVLDSYWGSEGMGLYAGSASIYDTFAEAAADVQGYFIDDIPDLGSTSAFSWTLNDNYTGSYSVSDYYNTSYQFVSEPDNCTLVAFTANFKAADQATVLSDITSALTTAGYSLTSNSYYTIGTLTVGGVTTAQVIIDVNETYIAIDYAAESVDATKTYSTEAEAWADVNARMAHISEYYDYYGYYFPSTSSTAPTLASVEGSATPTAVTVMSSMNNIDYAIFVVELVYEFEEGVDVDAQVEAYTSALASTGGFLYSLCEVFTTPFYGYYNPTTGEMIEVYAYEGAMVIDIYELAYWYNWGYVTIQFETEDDVFNYINYFLGVAAETYNGLYSGVTIPTSTALLSFETYMSGITSMDVTEFAYYFDFGINAYNYYLNISFDEETDVQAQIDAYYAALAEAGWVYMYNSLVGFGYYNETTTEFVYIANYGTSIMVDVYVGDDYVFPVSSTEEEARTIATEMYSGVVETYGTDYFSATSSALPSFDDNGLAGYSGLVVYDDSSYLSYGYPIYCVSFYFSYEYDEDTSAYTANAEKAAAYEAALAASEEWTYMYCSLLGDFGYYNATTGEFASVMSTSLGVWVDVYIMPYFAAYMIEASFLGTWTLSIDGTETTLTLTDYYGRGYLGDDSSDYFYYDVYDNYDGTLTIEFTSGDYTYSLTYDPSTDSLSGTYSSSDGATSGTVTSTSHVSA